MMVAADVSQPPAARPTPTSRPAHVLVCVSGGADDLRLMRHGGLLARRLRARLTVLYVLCPALGPRPVEALLAVRTFAAALNASVVEAPAYTVVDGISDYVAARQITQVVLSEPKRTPWFAAWRESLPAALTRRLPPAVDVYVLGDHDLSADDMRR